MKKIFSWLGCLVAVLFLATNTTFANAKTDLSNKSVNEFNGNTVATVPEAPPLVALNTATNTCVSDNIGTTAVVDKMLTGFPNTASVTATCSAADPVPLISAFNTNVSGNKDNDQGNLTGQNFTGGNTATMAPKDDGLICAVIKNSWGTGWGENKTQSSAANVCTCPSGFYGIIETNLEELKI